MRMVAAFIFVFIVLAGVLVFATPVRSHIESVIFGEDAPITNAVEPVQRAVNSAVGVAANELTKPSSEEASEESAKEGERTASVRSDPVRP